MELKDLIVGMLKENTGIAMMDSGGEDGRKWQKNQTRDFENEPSVVIDPITDETESTEIYPTVSTYHYLVGSAELDLDDLCNEYNSRKNADWDSDIYGVSGANAKWLEKQGLTPLGESFNTYNYESMLDQVLQGTWMQLNESGNRDYLLLQVHGGADVRGGYTDAKLLVAKSDDVLHDPIVSGTIDGVEVSTDQSPYGNTLADFDGKGVKVTKDSKIEVSLFPN